jgi:hypothetical protein
MNHMHSGTILDFQLLDLLIVLLKNLSFEYQLDLRWIQSTLLANQLS